MKFLRKRMNTNEKESYYYLQFWSALGPLVLLLVFGLISLGNPSSALILSTIILIGAICCFKWKKKGLIASIVIATAITYFFFNVIPSADRFWHIGMLLSAILGFVIMTLSSEESDAIVSLLQYSSVDKQQVLDKMHEQTLTTQRENQVERENLQSQVRELTENLRELSKNYQINQENIKSKDKLLEAARQEIDSTHQTRDKLLEESYKLRKDINQLQQVISNVQKEKYDLDTSILNLNSEFNAAKNSEQESRKLLQDHSRSIIELKEQLSRKDLELKKVSVLEQEITKAKEEKEREHAKAKSFEQELVNAKEQIENEHVKVRTLENAIEKAHEFEKELVNTKELIEEKQMNF